MAGCYWGAKTKPNKVAWGLFAALAILGIGFWVPGMLMTRKCLTKFSVCTGFTQAQARNNRLTQAPSNERVMRCVQQYRGCVTTPGIIWGVGWLFLVASCIPCFYFCWWAAVRPARRGRVQGGLPCTPYAAAHAAPRMPPQGRPGRRRRTRCADGRRPRPCPRGNQMLPPAHAATSRPSTATRLCPTAVRRTQITRSRGTPCMHPTPCQHPTRTRAPASRWPATRQLPLSWRSSRPPTASRPAATRPPWARPRRAPTPSSPSSLPPGRSRALMARPPTARSRRTTPETAGARRTAPARVAPRAPCCCSPRAGQCRWLAGSRLPLRGRACIFPKRTRKQLQAHPPTLMTCHIPWPRGAAPRAPATRLHGPTWWRRRCAYIARQRAFMCAATEFHRFEETSNAC
ncbi:MAG: hypothetical protein J3K34DRAFT_402242 [Monoraphidium minutum]|nr:MAG: hypothetical protein J3K34DRAFT_402242 [Monoraphidium minutum]